jgi:hypothetical protein
LSNHHPHKFTLRPAVIDRFLFVRISFCLHPRQPLPVFFFFPPAYLLPSPSVVQAGSACCVLLLSSPTSFSHFRHSFNDVLVTICSPTTEWCGIYTSNNINLFFCNPPLPSLWGRQEGLTAVHFLFYPPLDLFQTPTHLITPPRPHRRQSVQDHPTAPSPYLHSAPLYLDFLLLHPLTSCQKSFPLLTQPNCSPPSLTVPPSGRPPLTPALQVFDGAVTGSCGHPVPIRSHSLSLILNLGLSPLPVINRPRALDDRKDEVGTGKTGIGWES